MIEDKEKKLTTKEVRFINAWLQYFNATRAAKEAGYSERTAHVIGWENLRKPKIKAEIERRLDEVRMSKPEVLRRISDIAAGDMGEFLDAEAMGFDLDLKKAKEKGLTKLIRKVKQKTTIFIAKKESEEDREVHELEIELYPADDALKTLAKHHGLLTDKVEHTGKDGGPIQTATVRLYIPDNGRDTDGG